MHLFNDFYAPFTAWVYAHPQSALIITFLISFGESLAIVGSIIPGSITMTAVGIIAGSGYMRIDLTYLAGIGGAIFGDSASYLLGYYYSEKLTRIWPFTRYPHWLLSGKEYFAKHGGKSVLVGRFFGPLRSLIPVVAGMMHMHQGYFFLANFISAVLWAILYLTPGVLIGIASNSLPHESATRLFILILLVLIVLWLLGISLHWLIVRLNRWLHTNMHSLWIGLRHQKNISNMIQLVTPTNETNHFYTFALLCVWLISIIVFTILTIYSHFYAFKIDAPLFFLMQSLRSYKLDYFFVLISFLFSPAVIFAVDLLVLIMFWQMRNKYAVKIWLCLNFITCIALLIFTHQLNSLQSLISSEANLNNAFPAPNLTIAVSLFGFLIGYLSHTVTLAARLLKIFLFCFLLLVGFSYLFLGKYWFVSVAGAYLLGGIIAISHWLIYRKLCVIKPVNNIFIISVVVAICLGFSLTCYFNFRSELLAHQIATPHFSLDKNAWWKSKYKILPKFRMSRTGRPIATFNLQYVGSLATLRTILLKAGWVEQPDSFFKMLLIRIANPKPEQKIPLLTRLYMNKKPVLTMSYQPPQGPMLILHIWGSNYYIKSHNEPIWIGSLHNYYPSLLDKTEQIYPAKPYYYILPLLKNLQYKIADSTENNWLLISEKF